MAGEHNTLLIDGAIITVVDGFQCCLVQVGKACHGQFLRYLPPKTFGSFGLCVAPAGLGGFLASELTHSPCCLTLSRHLNVKGLINLLNATRTGITTHLTKVSIRSTSHLQYESSYCEVYQAIASSCPKVRELTLNLEGPSNCWHGVGLLPEGLTSLSLGACRFPPGLPLTSLMSSSNSSICTSAWNVHKNAT